MRYITFDVGETTGIVYGIVNGFDDFTVDCAIQVPYLNIMASIINLFDTIQPDIIIIENFKLYAHKAITQINSEIRTIRVIGMIEAYTFIYNKNRLPICQIHYQMAYQIKSTPPIQIKPEHKSLFKGLPHAKDAYKHTRLYSIRNYKNEERR